MPNPFRIHFLGLILAAAAPLTSHAVVVAGGDGTQNTTAPLNDFGFANVGQLYSPTDGFFQSCVFLQGHWIITAYHSVRNADATGFALGQVIFNDPDGGPVAFAPVEGSGVRLRNADSSFTDLALFQIAEVPTFLTPTVIASQTPAVGSSLILAGNGIPREPTLTRWNVNAGTWTEVATGGTKTGYELTPAPSTVRWGTNQLENNGGVLPVPSKPTVAIDGGFGSVTAIRTDFDNVSGEAHGVFGDSGGGVFYERGTWELLGVIVTSSREAGQPVNSAVFGNSTYAAHLPTYRTQILATIPEPSTAGMLIFGASALALRRRERSRKSKGRESRA